MNECIRPEGHRFYISIGYPGEGLTVYCNNAGCMVEMNQDEAESCINENAALKMAIEDAIHECWDTPAAERILRDALLTEQDDE